MKNSQIHLVKSNQSNLKMMSSSQEFALNFLYFVLMQADITRTENNQ